MKLFILTIFKCINFTGNGYIHIMQALPISQYFNLFKRNFGIKLDTKYSISFYLTVTIIILSENSKLQKCIKYICENICIQPEFVCFNSTSGFDGI